MDLTSFSIEQALKLTKHPKTSRDALKMSKPAFWSKTKRATEMIWGHFKGKSIQTYQTRVALNKQFYFHCNCSSRLQPCRHALALLILFLERPSSFRQVAASDEMRKWWAQLTEPKKEKPKKPSTANAQRPSLTKRIAKMKSGIVELDTWLHDLMKQGLSSLAGENKSSLDSIRQRLTDAGLGGLRATVDEIEEILNSSPRWPELILQPIARLKALAKGVEKLDELKPAWQREILQQCGVYVRREELEALPVVEDQWALLWREVVERADGGHQRKAWLYGQQSTQYALLLEFNFREPKFMNLPKPGRWFKAAVTYYPSPFPLRVMMRWSSNSTMPLEHIESLKNFKALQQAFRAAMKLNPWLRGIPMAVNINGIHIEKEQLWVIDESKRSIELQILGDAKWQLLAIAKDVGPCIIVGEFDGLQIKPLGLLANQTYFSLSEMTVFTGS